MALILKKEIGGKKCWACGFVIENAKPAVTLTAAMEIAYLHPNCARSIAQQLLRDIAQLIDLGYEVEESWETD